MPQLLELDKDDNVHALLETDVPAQEVLNNPANSDRNLVALPEGITIPDDVEEHRYVDGRFEPATKAHKNKVDKLRVEERKREASMEKETRKRERIEDLKDKEVWTDEERDELIRHLLRRAD